jgi:hypothetical protein
MSIIQLNLDRSFLTQIIILHTLLTEIFQQDPSDHVPVASLIGYSLQESAAAAFHQINSMLDGIIATISQIPTGV